MTRSCCGLERRLNGSMVTRTLRVRWVRPSASVTTPSRRSNASYARGQSSSVPSSNPITCSTSATSALLSVTGGPHPPQQPGQVWVERVPPRDPVVRVGHLGELDRIAVPPQRLRHVVVVGEVLLHRAAGQHRRHGGPIGA